MKSNEAITISFPTNDADELAAVHDSLFDASTSPTGIRSLSVGKVFQNIIDRKRGCSRFEGSVVARVGTANLLGEASTEDFAAALKIIFESAWNRPEIYLKRIKSDGTVIANGSIKLARRFNSIDYCEKGAKVGADFEEFLADTMAVLKIEQPETVKQS